MLTAELLDDLRQPVAGDGLIRRHADAVLLVGVDEGDLTLQRGDGGETVAHHGQYTLPGGRQTHAAAPPHQHREAQILFQTVHHVGKPGLGVAQHLGGAGEAAQLHGGEQSL